MKVRCPPIHVIERSSAIVSNGSEPDYPRNYSDVRFRGTFRKSAEFRNARYATSRIAPERARSSGLFIGLLASHKP